MRHSDTFTAFAAQELGCQVVAEYRFHPKRLWRFDYALPQFRIAIEIDGGVWTQGRHTRGAGWLKDSEKLNTAAVMGWRMLRFTPDQKFTNKTIETIKAAMNNQ